MTRILLRSALVIIITAVNATAQTTITPYFTVDQLADATNYLPPPPDTTSVQFAYDLSQYYWGKSLRDTERGQQAIYDSQGVYTVMCENFSDAFGMTISPQNTPDIYTVVANTLKTTSNATSLCKNYYKRERPFQRFHEEEMITGETLSATSYPSTHSAKGWILALLLGEINPKAQEALLVKGYEYGQSRVIVGAHWQSDVDAGRLVGCATYSRLHSDSTFIAHLNNAKLEYKRILRTSVNGHYDLLDPSSNLHDNAELNNASSDIQWYTIDGKKADDNTRGIVVGRGRKVLRTDR